MTGCFRRDVTYDGDYPELFSVAIHSLLGARGYEVGHLSLPDIRVISEDNHGRVLFSYREDTISSHLIIQKVDSDYAYFYPHYNFILGRIQDVPERDIEALKEMNNWNQPVSDRSEFERVPIVRLKEEGPIPREILVEVCHEIFPDNPDSVRTSTQNVSGRMPFLRVDRYGRSVYFRSLSLGTFAVIFQPDHSFDLETGVLEITDINNYQTELRLFMEANGWNEPWDE